MEYETECQVEHQLSSDEEHKTKGTTQHQHRHPIHLADFYNFCMEEDGNLGADYVKVS